MTPTEGNATEVPTVVVMPNNPPVSPPRRRRLRVFAFDPMTTRLAGSVLTLDLPMEPLTPGPVGQLLQVVDFHPPSDSWLVPIDLNDPALVHQDGIRPSESDPRSHQQMVYAVASSVIERFERFLGRRFRWPSDRRLVLVPHAFEGRNAFFDPGRGAVLFGYFKADATDPGRNLPGQTIFTCLSIDIIAHEVTNALVHRLRKYYVQPSNPDVLAWHEAFADLVALFHHFVFPEVVRQAVASSFGDLTEADGLFDLATEFGESVGRGKALRNAIRHARPGSTPEVTRQFASTTEPHERGAIFVSAVFDAYITSYRRRISDLIRIATGGTGVLPPGHLHPDLVNRVAKEATVTADRYLGIVVRAFDYLPVVDATFGDVVRAIVTADRDLHPDDEAGLRSTLIEALRGRGIYPGDAASLAEESLSWPRANGLKLWPDAVDHLATLVAEEAQRLDPAGEPPADEPGDTDQPEESGGDPLHGVLLAWARANAEILGFDPDKDAGLLSLVGRHVSFRQAQDRQPQPEIVIQITQRRRDLEGDLFGDDVNGFQIRAGATLIVTMTGEVRYVISKPLPFRAAPGPQATAHQLEQHRIGTARLEHIRRALQDAESVDLTAAWASNPGPNATFQRLHLTVDTEAL